ncbi:MAG: response regulator [Deltaproteobacteria bacterium]|nr:response regulator [Deltaproteobacteria bacterium]
MRAPKNRNPVRILLLEDNLEHAALIQKTLQESIPGVLIKTVASLNMALQELAKSKSRRSKTDYDLILTDYSLSNTSGTTLVKRIKKETPQIPLIIITGRGDERIAAEVIKLGAEDYIVKSRESLKALGRIIQRTLLKKKASNFPKAVSKSIVGRLLFEIEQLTPSQFSYFLKQLRGLQSWTRRL